MPACLSQGTECLLELKALSTSLDMAINLCASQFFIWQMGLISLTCFSRECKPSQMLWKALGDPRLECNWNRDYFMPAGLHALAGALEVHGEVGRSVALRCPYSPEHDAAEKLWCKYEGTWCLSILASLGNTGDGHHGRAAVHEIRENRTFALTMEGLQVNDTGIYECRIQMPGEDSIMLLNILLHISAGKDLSANTWIAGLLEGGPVWVCSTVVCLLGCGLVCLGSHGAYCHRIF